jgi:NTE family protein
VGNFEFARHSFTSEQKNNKGMNEPKVALVLGGGGLKPYSVIPLLKFLEMNNIKLDLIVGCSGGAIMSALLASGYSPDDIINNIVTSVNKKIFRPDFRALASIAGLPFSKMDKERAFIKAAPIRKHLREIFGYRRIEDLRMKTIFQATDFETGEGVGLESGDVADCVYASSAIFPLLPAVKIGERWLFDGCFSAPVPVLHAVRHRPDIIIVADFIEKLSPDPQGYYEAAIHTGKIYSKTIAAAQTCLTINLHEGEVIYVKVIFDKYISIWEIEKMPAILEVGEIALEKVKGEILLSYDHYKQQERLF